MDWGAQKARIIFALTACSCRLILWFGKDVCMYSGGIYKLWFLPALDKYMQDKTGSRELQMIEEERGRKEMRLCSLWLLQAPWPIGNSTRYLACLRAPGSHLWTVHIQQFFGVSQGFLSAASKILITGQKSFGLNYKGLLFSENHIIIHNLVAMHPEKSCI